MGMGDIGLAMQGITQGVNQTVQKRQLVEDQDKERRALEVQRAEEKRKADYNASIEDLQRDMVADDAEISKNQATASTQTLEGGIKATNAENSAGEIASNLAKDTDQARIDLGAAADTAEGEAAQRDSDQITRETQNDKNEYIKKEIQAKVAQGVPHAEAVEQASSAWNKVNEDKKQNDEYQTAIDQAATDRMNGVPAEQAVTRKIIAGAERRKAEMGAKRVKLMQNSTFDEDQFAREEVDNFMEQGRAAILIAGAGDTKKALSLLDVDKDGDGTGDLAEAGAVDTRLIKRGDGTSTLVAVDKDGNVVKDETGAPAILNDVDIKKYFDDKKLAGATPEIPKSVQKAIDAANAVAADPKPMKIEEYKNIEDTIDDVMATQWGMGVVGKDGEVDKFNLELGNVLPDSMLDGPLFERPAKLDKDGRIIGRGEKVKVEEDGAAFYGNTVDQLEIDMKTNLATASRFGGLETVAPKYATLPNAVKETYKDRIFPETFQAAVISGIQQAAIDAQLAGEAREGFILRAWNSFGDKDKYKAMPDSIKKHINAKVLKLASQVQAQMLREERESDPAAPPAEKP